MIVDRRSLMAGAGAMLATGLAPRAAAALVASDALILAPAMRPDGGFAVVVLGERGDLIREIALPARGHDLAIDRDSGRAVAFARRPGTFAVAFDIFSRSAPKIFVARPDRHFFGHGAAPIRRTESFSSPPRMILPPAPASSGSTTRRTATDGSENFRHAGLAHMRRSCFRTRKRSR
jgi:hypothetical protein